MEKHLYPKGYHALSPILRVEDVTAALEFYKNAFGGTEDFRREVGGRLLLGAIKSEYKEEVPHDIIEQRMRKAAGR